MRLYVKHSSKIIKHPEHQKQVLSADVKASPVSPFCTHKLLS